MSEDIDDTRSAVAKAVEIAQLRAEIERLRAENAAFREAITDLGQTLREWIKRVDQQP